MLYEIVAAAAECIGPNPDEFPRLFENKVLNRMKNPENRLKRALAEGRRQIGVWHTLGGSVGAELLANTGFDWVLVDTEHSAIEVRDVLPCLQALAAYPETSAAVRVADNDTALIKRHLDQGAQTIMVPNIRSAEEARRAVAAMHYPTRGVRGMAGLTRATRFGAVEAYPATAGDELCLILQIETLDALAALDEIAAVEGVDSLFIGPSDLSASMGHAGDLNAPAVKTAILDTLDRLARLGKPSGLLTLDPDFAETCIEHGAQLVTVAIDMAAMLQALRPIRDRFLG